MLEKPTNLIDDYISTGDFTANMLRFLVRDVYFNALYNFKF